MINRLKSGSETGEPLFGRHGERRAGARCEGEALGP